MLKRRQKTDKAKLIEQCEALFRQIVRARDNDTCQKCGKVVAGANCHVSHVIPRSRDKRLSIDPLNGKVMCYHDHLNWWHKHPCESGVWFRETFPDRWAYLEVAHKHNRQLGTISIVWYRERLEQLKAEILS